MNLTQKTVLEMAPELWNCTIGKSLSDEYLHTHNKFKAAYCFSVFIKNFKGSFNHGYRTEWKYNQQSNGETKENVLDYPVSKIFFPPAVS